MKLSTSVQQLSPSLTLKISGKAKAMKRQGIPVIDFSVGEPDFTTPNHVKDAGIQAIQDNFTGYTQSDGIPELKAAVIERLRKDDDLSFESDQIIFSTGAKMSIFLALAAVVNPGDEVIIPAPYWVSYPEQVKLAGATPKIIDTRESDGFLLQAQALKEAISTSTRAIILNNPSNPTGAAYSESQLRDVLTVAHEANLFIIADEIYSKITYPGLDFVRALNVLPEIADHTVLIDGVSKSYSMTGWRIGFAAGPRDVIGGMKRIQGHMTSNPVSISQKAAVAAYEGDQSQLTQRVSEFQKRRDYIVNAFNGFPGIATTIPQGAFYVFPNISSFIGKSVDGKVIGSALDLCDYLLDTAHVALVPGEGFGAPDNIRLSFATSMDNIKEGLIRLEKALEKIK